MLIPGERAREMDEGEATSLFRSHIPRSNDNLMTRREERALLRRRRDMYLPSE